MEVTRTLGYNVRYIRSPDTKGIRGKYDGGYSRQHSAGDKTGYGGYSGKKQDTAGYSKIQHTAGYTAGYYQNIRQSTGRVKWSKTHNVTHSRMGNGRVRFSLSSKKRSEKENRAIFSHWCIFAAVKIVVLFWADRSSESVLRILTTQLTSPIVEEGREKSKRKKLPTSPPKTQSRLNDEKRQQEKLFCHSPTGWRPPNHTHFFLKKDYTL